MLSKEFLEIYADPDREPAARQARPDHATTPDVTPAAWSPRDLRLWLAMACACFFFWAILMAVADHL